MKNKVVFPELVAELAAVTNTSEALCEAFLKELFSLVAVELSKGKAVKIKKLGEFSVLPDGNVHFEPDKDISESLNAAFACFEPIELDDNVTDEELNKCEEMQPTDDTEIAETENVDAIENTDVEMVGDDEPVSEESVEESTDEASNVGDLPESQDNVGETAAAVETPVELSAELADEQEEAVDENNGNNKRVFWRGYAWGALTAVVVVCIVAVAFHWDAIVGGSEESSVLVHETEDTDSIEEQSAKVDTAASAPIVQQGTVPMAEEKDSLPKSDVAKEWPKTFKVTSTAYLSNVSRKFYGHYAFWIYIYIENKDVIANPDNLPIGVVLNIPDPQKYDIDKDDPNSIKKAQLRALEIKK